jgi:hypothetical protein
VFAAAGERARSSDQGGISDAQISATLIGMGHGMRLLGRSFVNMTSALWCFLDEVDHANAFVGQQERNLRKAGVRGSLWLKQADGAIARPCVQVMGKLSLR